LDLREGVGVLTPPIEPMLARSNETLPSAGYVRDAIWQQKVDGYRVIAYLRSGTLYLQSRRGADLSPAFPDLVAAATRVEDDLVLDGELVVFQGGRLDFAALQQRARLTGVRAVAAAHARPPTLSSLICWNTPGRCFSHAPAENACKFCTPCSAPGCSPHRGRS
jgi:ATP-dependent DNA ligase